MNKIQLENDTFSRMEKHASSTFPEECCGFMFGSAGDEKTIVEDVSAVKNRHPDFKARRYLISPEDFMEAEKFADDRGLSLTGVYHSHPNHPALPSERDREAALPGFTYIIFSVNNGNTTDVTAWELAEDRSEFKAVEILKREE